MEGAEGTRDVQLCRELLKAAELGDVETVRELLKRDGIDTKFGSFGAWGHKTVLVVSCEHGHADVLRVILEHGEEGEEELGTGFVFAILGEHCEVVKVLMELKVGSVQRNYGWALLTAAELGYAELVKMLLQDPCTDPADQAAVCMAAEYGQFEALAVLLADNRVDGTRAIRLAKGRAIDVLLEDERCGVNVNRSLFELHQSKELTRYEKLADERTARICAVSWCLKMIGDGWGDVREPTEARMSVHSVFAGE